MQAINNVNPMLKFKSSFQPWIVCFAATLFFFYEFIQGNMFATIGDHIMRDFHIEANQMTYLSSIYYLSNVIFLFVAGLMLDRFSIKKIIIGAMAICVISTMILAQSDSFYVALICRFMTGIGSAFCFLGPVRLAAQWFPPQRMALVTGAIVTMAMTGGMLAQYPLTVLVSHVGWRHAVQYVGVLGVIMLVIMSWGIKERKESLEDQPKPTFDIFRNILGILKSLQNVYSNKQYLRAAAYTSLMNMSVAVLGALAGSMYLQQRLNIGADKASAINSMLFLGAIFGGPLIGGLSDKLGVRLLPMKIGVIASLSTLLAILYLPIPYQLMMVLFFLLGFVTSAQVISYALVAESSPSNLTATAISVISILTQGGYVIYQNLFSRLLAYHGEVQYVNHTPVYSLADYQYAVVILPIGLIIAFLCLSGLKETHCQSKEVSI